MVERPPSLAFRVLTSIEDCRQLGYRAMRLNRKVGALHAIMRVCHADERSRAWRALGVRLATADDMEVSYEEENFRTA